MITENEVTTMQLRTRILTILLLEKLENDPVYAQMLGLEGTTKRSCSLT